MVWLWVWGVATAIALIIEFITSDLITIWFGAGGLVTLLVVALVPDLHLAWQTVIFIAVSALLLLIMRRPCIRLLKNNDDMQAEQLVGKKFVVKRIYGKYTYQSIEGVWWRICAADGEKLISGQEMEICEVKGKKITAKPVAKDKNEQ